MSQRNFFGDGAPEASWGHRSRVNGAPKSRANGAPLDIIGSLGLDGVQIKSQWVPLETVGVPDQELMEHHGASRGLDQEPIDLAPK